MTGKIYSLTQNELNRCIALGEKDFGMQSFLLFSFPSSVVHLFILSYLPLSSIIFSYPEHYVRHICFCHYLKLSFVIFLLIIYYLQLSFIIYFFLFIPSDSLYLTLSSVILNITENDSNEAVEVAPVAANTSPADDVVLDSNAMRVVPAVVLLNADSNDTSGVPVGDEDPIVVVNEDPIVVETADNTPVHTPDAVNPHAEAETPAD